MVTLTAGSELDVSLLQLSAERHCLLRYSENTVTGRAPKGKSWGPGPRFVLKSGWYFISKMAQGFLLVSHPLLDAAFIPYCS